MFNYLKHNPAQIIFGLVISLAAFIRFFAAPFSSGPDVAQFWAFAEVFRQHGIDFYRFAGANQAIFPYQGWAYAYPPIWLLILGLAFLFVPSSFAGPTYIDPSWRLAVKTPIILADLAIGILLFWGLPGSKWRRLLFSTLWLLNPTTWYNSAVFGQFDAIASALLVASLILLSRGRTSLLLPWHLGWNDQTNRFDSFGHDDGRFCCPIPVVKTLQTYWHYGRHRFSHFHTIPSYRQHRNICQDPHFFRTES